jgi:hypothetical protein
MCARRVQACLFAIAAVVLTAPAAALDVTVVNESEPQPGIVIQQLSIAAPKTNAWVAFVDLCTPHVRVDATAAPSSLRTAGSFAAGIGAQLAVNGDFYATGPLRVYGGAAGDGAAWPAVQTGADPGYANQWYYQNYGWIAFGSHSVEVNHTQWVKNNAEKFGGLREGWRPTDVTHAIPEGTLALVSGFPELVVEGTQFTCSSPTAGDCFPDRSDMRARHPRTAMGITKDRRSFILAVVDGRTSTSIGMYGAELAELMYQLGAWTAFNLDGGGSSQMWLSGQGYLNNTSGNNLGNGTRAVANHWGVFAGAASGTAKAPAHCVDYLVEGVLNVAAHENKSSDIDGDGRADACLRATDGLRCAMASDRGFAADALLLPLGDQDGWDDLRNAATLRMGDVDGDGLADACARANAGIRCWLSDAGPLATQIVGPEHGDDVGWNNPAYHTTLRLADVDGDGRDDVCARASIGLVCYPSSGSGFGDRIDSGHFSDADGFLDPDNYMTLRMGDVDGDGLADACGRYDDGIHCYLAPDFSTEIVGPAWSDDNGWHNPRYWSSIRLIDLDGDGRADLCGRAAKGLLCHLSGDGGFGDGIDTGLLADADGFDAPDRYSTIRFGDIDGDRDADLCAGPAGPGQARALATPSPDPPPIPPPRSPAVSTRGRAWRTSMATAERTSAHAMTPACSAPPRRATALPLPFWAQHGQGSASSRLRSTARCRSDSLRAPPAWSGATASTTTATARSTRTAPAPAAAAAAAAAMDPGERAPSRATMRRPAAVPAARRDRLVGQRSPGHGSALLCSWRVGAARAVDEAPGARRHAARACRGAAGSLCGRVVQDVAFGGGELLLAA